MLKTENSLLIEQAYLVVAWIIYLGTHSLFAANNVKKYAAGIMGKTFAYYRVIYVILSTVLLGLLGLYILWPPYHMIYSQNAVSFFAGILIGIPGLWIVRKAFKEYDLSEFLGTLYLNTGSDGDASLKTSGILKYVRHPLYTATLLVVLSFFLLFPSLKTLTSDLCIVIYTVIGIRLEENKLVEAYGDSYRDYRKKVPMLIPKLRVHRKNNVQDN